MTVLPAAAAYRAWADHYEAETAVSFLEDRTIRRMSPPPTGLRLLDVGCGTGRRLRSARPALGVGIDLTFEMLHAGLRPIATPGAGEGIGVSGASRASRASGFVVREAGGVRPPGRHRADDEHLDRSIVHLAAADAREMPLRSQEFDLVWCRLMIGHLPEIERAYTELARVCAPGGSVLVTDLHPIAATAGHRRTFRDATGALREVEHYIHQPSSHVRAANGAGLEPSGGVDARVGPEIEPFYVRAGKHRLYFEQLGLPLVLAMAFRRPQL